MKFWIAAILSIALIVLGPATAAQAAMDCHGVTGHTDASDAETLSGTAITCAHCDQNHDSDHGKPSAPGHASKCVSSCCGTLSFIPADSGAVEMGGSATYRLLKLTVRANALGIVQERPPKLLG